MATGESVYSLGGGVFTFAGHGEEPASAGGRKAPATGPTMHQDSSQVRAPAPPPPERDPRVARPAPPRTAPARRCLPSGCPPGTLRTAPVRARPPLPPARASGARAAEEPAGRLGLAFFGGLPGAGSEAGRAFRPFTVCRSTSFPVSGCTPDPDRTPPSPPAPAHRTPPPPQSSPKTRRRC